MNRLIILGSLIILCVYQSCKEKEEEGVMCTEEFRMIGITVTGDSLTDYYTVRNSNLDTIRFTDDVGIPKLSGICNSALNIVEFIIQQNG